VTTPARYRALQWFADHEQDPTSVLLGPRPTVRMSRLMSREHQVMVVPPGRWILTGLGINALAKRPKKRTTHARAQQADPAPRDARSDAPAEGQR
jgi:hypothetical protein